MSTEAIDSLESRPILTSSTKPTVLFFTDNGRGLGHLTRLLAVAKRGAHHFQPYFLTLSLGVQLLRDNGVPAEFFPAYHQLGLSKREWLPLLNMRLAEAIREFEVRAVVVDHVIPPESFRTLRNNLAGVDLIWSRRGLWRAGKNSEALELSDAFHRIVEPGDLAAPIDVGPTSMKRSGVQAIAPIVLVTPDEYESRARSRERLGLPPNGRAVLLNLGDSSSDELRRMVEHSRDIVRAAVRGERFYLFAPLHPLHGDEVQTIEGVKFAAIYPVARYLKAFDAVISTAGYNSFHEIAMSGVPALFVPHRGTNVDDQTRRARFAKLCGRAAWAPTVYHDDFRAGVAQILDPAEGAISAAVTEKLGSMDGASEFAEILGSVAARRRSERHEVVDLTPALEDRKEIARRINTRSSRSAVGPASAGSEVVVVDATCISDTTELVKDVMDLQRESPSIAHVVILGESSPQPLVEAGIPFESVLSPAEWNRLEPKGSYDDYLSRRIRQAAVRTASAEVVTFRPGGNFREKLTVEAPARRTPLNASRQHRSYALRLPSRTGQRRELEIETPSHLYVPKLLERDGLAGYEPHSLACWLAILSQDGIGSALDIGANVGLYAWLAAAHTQRRVFAFEPTPELAHALSQIAKRNQLAIDIETVALADRDGTATLYLSDSTDSSNSLAQGFRSSSASIEVNIQTLDEFVTEFNVHPYAIKIDTETTEPAVLNGGPETLRRRPWLIVEVLAKRTESELMEAIEPFGYNWYRIDDHLPLQPRSEIEGDPEHRWLNWLFAPEPPSERFWNDMSAWLAALSECHPSG